jgi:hypothetical protein
MEAARTLVVAKSMDRVRTIPPVEEKQGEVSQID